MSDELIDIVDENDTLTGEQKMKSISHADGSWHRVTHNWIYNSQNEVLLQLRAKEKILYPNKLDVSAAGHVSAGENIKTSAIREIKEEIGIKIRESDLEFLKKFNVHIDYNGMKNNEIYYVFTCKYDGPMDNLKLQTEEVAKIKFIPVDKVKEEFIKNPDKFTPGKEYWFSILDKIKDLNSRK